VIDKNLKFAWRILVAIITKLWHVKVSFLSNFTSQTGIYFPPLALNDRRMLGLNREKFRRNGPADIFIQAALLGHAGRTVRRQGAK